MQVRVHAVKSTMNDDDDDDGGRGVDALTAIFGSRHQQAVNVLVTSATTHAQLSTKRELAYIDRWKQ
jgi:hypothetical protein